MSTEYHQTVQLLPQFLIFNKSFTLLEVLHFKHRVISRYTVMQVASVGSFFFFFFVNSFGFVENVIFALYMTVFNSLYHNQNQAQYKR